MCRNNLKIISYCKFIGNYRMEEVVLFNENHISEDDVKNLIDNGMVEHSNDVVVMTATQYANLCEKGK